MKNLLRPLITVLLLLPLTGCLFGVVDLRLRDTEVKPVPVGFEIAPDVLAARLAQEVEGLGGYGDREGYGTWSTVYGSGDAFAATLSWSKHVLTVEVRVDEGAENVTFEVLETANLAERNGRIHRTGVLHLRDLREKVAEKVRAERLLARSGATDRPPPTPAVVTPAVAPPAPLAPSRLTPSQPVVGVDGLGGVDPGRYHALVIGNNSYQALPGLRTAIPDAAMIASVLELDYGFDVQLITDADRREIVSALNGYRTRLTDHDNLLIYYAGHGWYDEEAGRGYWLPVDSEKGDPSNWLSNATITDMVRAMPAKHVMIVADSCYSGTLTRGINMQPRPENETYLSRIVSKRARTAMTSGGLEPVEDGSGRHSVFATAFTEALRASREPIDGQTVFARIRRPVMIGADQTPEYGDIRRAGHDGGDFLFVPRR